MSAKISRFGAYGIVLDKDRILLTKKTSGPYRGLWDLPGGGIEFGESPEVALMRELYEETSMHVHDFSLIGTSTAVHDYSASDFGAHFHQVGVMYFVNHWTYDANHTAEEVMRWVALSEVCMEQLTPFGRWSVAYAKQSQPLCSTVQLNTDRTVMRTPRKDDLEMIVAFENRNREHLERWETLPPTEKEAHLASARHRLDAWVKECESGISLRFFIFPKDDPNMIIGFCNFTQICRGAFQACYLGYKLDRAYENQGLMAECLKRSTSYIFEDLNLHRIMANYMPTNERSANLLSRLGFVVEGYAKAYLYINGYWEDHVLTSLTQR